MRAGWRAPLLALAFALALVPALLPVPALGAAAAPARAADLVSLVRAGKTNEVARQLTRVPFARVDAHSRGVLLLTALENDRADIVDVLVDWGLEADVPVEVRFSDGQVVRAPPLHLAVTLKAAAPVLQVLVRRGARVDAPSDGLRPLSLALSAGQFDTASTLLDLGADPLARDPVSGHTALFDVVLSAHGDRLDAGLALARRLRSAGVDVNAAGVRGSTALTFAVLGGEPRMVRWLLAQGARVDVTGTKGESLVQMARRKGHAEVVDALLQAGAAP